MKKPCGEVSISSDTKQHGQHTEEHHCVSCIVQFIKYVLNSKMATSSEVGVDAKSCFGDDSAKMDGDGDQSSKFECNICLDVARDAVVSLCGHLFW